MIPSRARVGLNRSWNAFAQSTSKCQGMRLNVEQVQRLCGMERSMNKVALDVLVETRFLCLRTDGPYVRLDRPASRKLISARSAGPT